MGMLHPAEFLELRRQDLLLPQDSLVDHEVLYIHIRNPKTARFARRQHCKVDDPAVLAYVTRVFGDLQPSEALFAGGPSAFRRRWNEVMANLGIPAGSQAVALRQLFFGALELHINI